MVATPPTANINFTMDIFNGGKWHVKETHVTPFVAAAERFRRQTNEQTNEQTN